MGGGGGKALQSLSCKGLSHPIPEESVLVTKSNPPTSAPLPHAIPTGNDISASGLGDGGDACIHTAVFSLSRISPLVFLKDQVWTPGLQRTVRPGCWNELVVLVDYNSGVKYGLCADKK